MVSPSQLASWRPARLSEIADEIATHRTTLTRLDDDLATGRPPASWTFADADSARTEHDRLTAALATQVSETVGVVSALDAAATSIQTAQNLLEGAMRRAGSHGLHVDTTTGAVSSTKTYDDPEDLEYARTVMNEVAEQITTALTDAQAADDALAAALSTAATTDVNTVGSLEQQRQVLEFQELSPADQAQYLLDHPGDYALLDDYTSPEVKALVGQEIAGELDDAARDATAFGDADQVARLNGLLGAFGDDPAVMAPMYERLGPDGLLATYNGMSSMMYVGSNVEELGALAGELRSGLQAASTAPGFDGKGFGEDLVRYATYGITDDERDAFQYAYPSASGGGAAVLDYLLREGEYGEGFVRGVAWELDEFERADPQWAQTWMHHNSFASPLNGLDSGDSLTIREPDPMASVMGQLGKHPGLGLEFFSDGKGEDRSEFYFGKRDWSRDGFGGISEAALAIGTDPDNLAADPEKTGMFVSRFFDQLPDNPRFDAEHAAAGAEPVADLLKHYMPSVEAAAAGDGADHGARLRDFTTNAYLGTLLDYPVLDKVDLDGLLKVALSTEDGMSRIAEGVAGFRQMQLTNFALQHPGVDGAQANFADLQKILNDGSRLEGYMQHSVGDIAIEGAKSADQQVAVFTGLVSEAAGLLPVPFADEAGDALGEVGKKAWEAAWGHVQQIPTDHVTEAFGNNEDAARNEQTGEAQLGRERMVISTYLSLAQAGVLEVPETMRDTWMPGGQIVSLESIRPEDLQTFRSEAADALSKVLSVTELELTYKDPFTSWNGE
ncbi:hypothetical protein [Cellulomonas hominis]|uniref:hypothetical protein n=1 Tax=Cellulomonas hominis TaxID=156981 RepID=UPI001B9FD712|nr:hypothetical protein [Cellulomonas hominis]VTR78924.1 hypothetical protein CHMI_03712 [Cellulomonas hominis]